MREILDLEIAGVEVIPETYQGYPKSRSSPSPPPRSSEKLQYFSSSNQIHSRKILPITLALSRTSDAVRRTLPFYRILAAITVLLIFLLLFTSVPFLPHFKTPAPRVVIILAANEGGGVLRWKLPQEWLVERSSIANKKHYAKDHGYALKIVDTAVKRRYAHEWRELWEKVDIMRDTMREFPDTEWFWWLDLHTYIMEPQVLLDEHVFSRLDEISYRLLHEFNPLDLPVDIPYTDLTKQINLLITQDCGGFNLGSFIMRRSEWLAMLLDIWWDPVHYEQKHMEWEHKEQDALESLYLTQSWIREGTAFLPLRAINAFPPGACLEQSNDDRYFYNEEDRDFVINMAGCEWGRDCWGEMERYKALSKKLHIPKWKFWHHIKNPFRRED